MYLLAQVFLYEWRSPSGRTRRSKSRKVSIEAEEERSADRQMELNYGLRDDDDAFVEASSSAVPRMTRRIFKWNAM